MRTKALLACLALIAAGCAETAEETPETLTLVSHNSFAEGVVDETFATFTAETGIAVEVVGAGDAGSMVNQAILSKDNPFADVLFGVDDTFLSRALEEEIFIPHSAAGIDSVREELRDPGDRVTPIDFGDVCVNYDKEWFETNGAEVPTTLEGLGDMAGELTVEHPATSSPGLAFMLATIEHFGEEGWLDYWARLRDGGVTIVSDWDTAYYSEFTRYGGDTPLVVSYASSPPAEVLFATEPTDTAPTGVIEAGCYRQVEYAGVLAGTPHPEAAGQLVDYMLSVEFQEQIPLSWFVFPVNPDATLPDEFVEHTVIPEDPARLSSERIAENRDAWIDQWVEVMEQR
jgi:thiamine transport system substrate-binding protein